MKDCTNCKFAPRHWRLMEPTSGAPWREGLCAMRGVIRHGSISSCKDWDARLPARKTNWRPELEQRGPVTGGLFGRGEQ